MRNAPFIILVFFLWSAPLHAEEYEMDRSASTIQASVRYTVLGVYTAEFKAFESAFYFDEDHIKNSFVEMVFQTQSIDSGRDRFDRIVRSERLLDAEQYPEITFRSYAIERRGETFWVKGELDLHGVKRIMEFPFELKAIEEDTLEVKGRWAIARKDFDIVWHPVLDVGGILVGNTITLHWDILLHRN